MSLLHSFVVIHFFTALLTLKASSIPGKAHSRRRQNAEYCPKFDTFDMDMNEFVAYYRLVLLGGQALERDPGTFILRDWNFDSKEWSNTFHHVTKNVHSIESDNEIESAEFLCECKK